MNSIIFSGKLILSNTMGEALTFFSLPLTLFDLFMKSELLLM